jgi:sugar O-acyltransferase (sialic acid O-acetyltransferase NeuD family)
MSGLPLVIVGAGGHGREAAWAFIQDHPVRDFLGFLDDRPAATTPEGWPIIGGVAEWPRHQRACFLVAVNGTRLRRELVALMRRLGEPRWFTLLHPGAKMHSSCRIGPGSMVLEGARVTVSVAIGEFVIVNRGVQIGHDTRVGSYASLNPGAIVGGGVSIGEGVEIGSGASVRQGTEIGAGATVGMGAVVVSNLAPNEVAVGNPARVLREDASW